jgi:flagellar biosynthesis regulator FlaF
MSAIDSVKSKISKLPPKQQEELLALFAELEEAENVENSRIDFLTFVRKMWPAFIPGDTTQ